METIVTDPFERFATFKDFTPPEPEPIKLPNIYTADLETDPFQKNQMIAPFAAGFYDGQDFQLYWGDDCIEKFFKSLAYKEAGYIYIHNFGGFDFFWMLKYFIGKSTIRNGRIVSTFCKAANGYHELRDSYAIMPFALKEYHDKDGKKVKLDIDMDKLLKKNRQRYRDEIVKYLRRDCTSLHELVMRFLNRFGDKLTIGTTAMGEIQQVHDFIRVRDEEEDRLIRDRFFYGGRVQCFQSGVLKGNWKVYDVNSMYPYVMKNYQHPISRLDSVGTKITSDTAFLIVEGENHHAFPKRDIHGNLSFDCPSGTFGISIHEYRIAQKYGLFKTRRIVSTYNFKIQRPFDTFVDKFYSLRKKAKEEKDSAMSLFYKYILNSGYGKFAQDSTQYFDYEIVPDTVSLAEKEECEECKRDKCRAHWMIDSTYPEFGLVIWKRANPKPVFYNVATGCSITGAARSVLMEAYANATNPVYCDTDSIICEGLSGVKFSDSELGAWKLEAEGDTIAIAGKKMYAVFNARKVVKQANKGCQIEASEIKRLASNPEYRYNYERESPSLHLDGTHSFLKRTIRKTV